MSNLMDAIGGRGSGVKRKMCHVALFDGSEAWDLDLPNRLNSTCCRSVNGANIDAPNVGESMKFSNANQLLCAGSSSQPVCDRIQTSLEIPRGDGSRSWGNQWSSRFHSDPLRMSCCMPHDGPIRFTSHGDDQIEPFGLNTRIEPQWRSCPSTGEQDGPVDCQDQLQINCSIGSASAARAEAAEDGHLARMQYIFAHGTDINRQALFRHDNVYVRASAESGPFTVGSAAAAGSGSAEEGPRMLARQNSMVSPSSCAETNMNPFGWTAPTLRPIQNNQSPLAFCHGTRVLSVSSRHVRSHLPTTSLQRTVSVPFRLTVLKRSA
jgi:hypothetical protein